MPRYSVRRSNCLIRFIDLLHSVRRFLRQGMPVLAFGAPIQQQGKPMSGKSTISSRLQFNMIGDEAIAALRESKSFILSELPLPAQPVDATQALNLSAGVSNCKVSRGRSLS
jgi:hypothetical protein